MTYSLKSKLYIETLFIHVLLQSFLYNLYMYNLFIIIFIILPTGVLASVSDITTDISRSVEKIISRHSYLTKTLNSTNENRTCSLDTKKERSSKCNSKTHQFPNRGILIEVPGDKGCPNGMVRINNYCIDKYEAALVEVNQDGSWTDISPYHHPKKNIKIRAVSAKGAVPQGYINQIKAKQACHNSGKRLCTNKEWLRACQGSKKNMYPYGKKRVNKKCNGSRKIHPAVELFPKAKNPYSKIQNACINQLNDGLALTGEYSECVSDDGVFDMMGNLHEWTSDSSGIFRGGYYVDTKRNGPGCYYRTTAHDTSHWDYSTGFRCCANAAD